MHSRILDLESEVPPPFQAGSVLDLSDWGRGDFGHSGPYYWVRSMVYQIVRDIDEPTKVAYYQVCVHLDALTRVQYFEESVGREPCPTE